MIGWTLSEHERIDGGLQGIKVFAGCSEHASPTVNLAFNPILVGILNHFHGIPPIVRKFTQDLVSYVLPLLRQREWFFGKAGSRSSTK